MRRPLRSGGSRRPPRNGVSAALARDQFETGFFSNNAQTSLAIVIPDVIEDDEAGKIADRFVQQHTGANAWRPAVVSNGADIKPLAITQRDAQYIESKQFSIEEIARMFNISAVGMLRQAVGEGSATADDFERFLKVDMAPRLRRIEMTFGADRDLFPPDEDLFPEFLPDAILKPDIQSRFAAYKDAVQGGWMTANEIRERENFPARDDGDGLQVTPVGGAPNPSQGGEDG